MQNIIKWYHNIHICIGFNIVYLNLQSDNYQYIVARLNNEGEK